MKKRIFSLVLAAVMLLNAFSLTACKPQTSPVDAKPGEGALTTKSLQNVYKAEAVSTIGTVFENLRISDVVKMTDGKLLVSGYSTADYEDKYYITDETFQNASELTITKEQTENSETYINNLRVNPADGSIWYIKNVYTYEDGEAAIKETESSTMVSYYGGSAMVAVDDVAADTATVVDSEDRYYLVKVDANGNIVTETDMTAMMQVTDESGNTYTGYVNSMLFSGGYLVLCIENKLNLVNVETVQLEKTVTLDVDYVDMVFCGASGKIYFTSWGDSDMEVYSLNLENEKTEKEDFALSGRLYNYSYETGELGYELLLVDSNALYGYNPQDAEPTEICNYTNSDIDTRYNRTMPLVLDDGRLLLCYYDYDQNENEVLLLSRVDPSQVKEKYVITVAGRYINYDLKSALMKFNRTNDEYKVIFKDYSKYDTEDNEYQGAYQQLDKDILSKDSAPDIILLDTYGMDYESYISKGVFADLETFMDADESFHKEDYLENVFEAMKINGKLYTVTPTVNFMTLAGKKSVFGEKTHWTMQEFLDMHNSLGEGEQMFSEATRDGFGSMFLMIAKDEFIEDSGKCSFNSEDFQNILAYLKDIPADYTAYEEKWQENPNYWQENELSYSKGTTKLRPMYIYNFNVIPETEAYMGEEVTFIGYPSSKEDSVGAMIMPNEEIAINANSKVKAGCWEVLKYLLSDEYQNKYSGERDENGNGGDSYQVPIKKNILEKKMKNDIVPYYYTYTDENGEEVKEKQNSSTWIGDQEVELRDSTEEDVQRLYEIITKANVCAREDKKLTEIIMQDAQPYFDGQKSVEEVAGIINSRVQIYVNERQ